MAKVIPNRVFEDYDPPSDLVSEDNCDTLLIYLPGFKKEQLRVQLTTSRMLKISGERPIGENKYRRFHKEFRVPSNCETKDISAKFEGGILYIRQPKVITPAAPPQDQQSNAAVPAATQQQAPPQDPQVAAPSQPQQQSPQAQKHAPLQPQPPQTRPEQQQQPQPQQQNAERQPSLKDKKEEAKPKEEDGSPKKGKDELNSKDGDKKDVCRPLARPTQGVGGGLFRELRKPENLRRLAVSVLLVLIFGFYISYMFKSFSGDGEHSVLEYDGEL